MPIIEMCEEMEFDTPTIVLATGSPARKKILDNAGIPFVKKIVPIDEELLNAEIPHEGVSRRFAERYCHMLVNEKQKPFRGRVRNGVVVTCDTVVWCDGRILEKPLTREKCVECHEFVSGKMTYTVTAMAVYYNGKSASNVKTTWVKIAKLPPAVIDEVANEPATLLAAGYRTQGAIQWYIDCKKGEIMNVVGLYLPTLRRLLKKVDFPINPQWFA
ncbi:MAG: Maf family protein [Firmicutes bacterium]|nr:Maf family protein [Bacillota bacterium]